MHLRQCYQSLEKLFVNYGPQNAPVSIAVQGIVLQNSIFISLFTSIRLGNCNWLTYNHYNQTTKSWFVSVFNSLCSEPCCNAFNYKYALRNSLRGFCPELYLYFSSGCASVASEEYINIVLDRVN